MKWCGISGSWRSANTEVENAVRKKIAEIIKKGNGIITGGALGVDYFALSEALKLNPQANQIKVFLPVTLQIYTKHFRKRAEEGIITNAQAEMLINQLFLLQKVNPKALIENHQNTEVNNKTYYERNSEVVNASNMIYAFQINKSLGTQDTIDKAKNKGIPVQIFSYTIK